MSVDTAETSELLFPQQWFRERCDRCSKLTFCESQIEYSSGQVLTYFLCESCHDQLKIYSGYQCLKHPNTNTEWKDTLKLAGQARREAARKKREEGF